MPSFLGRRASGSYLAPFQNVSICLAELGFIGWAGILNWATRLLMLRYLKCGLDNQIGLVTKL
jgi:hypothetical protein